MLIARAGTDVFAINIGKRGGRKVVPSLEVEDGQTAERNGSKGREGDNSLYSEELRNGSVSRNRDAKLARNCFRRPPMSNPLAKGHSTNKPVGYTGIKRKKGGREGLVWVSCRRPSCDLRAKG